MKLYYLIQWENFKLFGFPSLVLMIFVLNFLSQWWLGSRVEPQSSFHSPDVIRMSYSQDSDAHMVPCSLGACGPSTVLVQDPCPFGLPSS